MNHRSGGHHGNVVGQWGSVRQRRDKDGDAHGGDDGGYGEDDGGCGEVSGGVGGRGEDDGG